MVERPADNVANYVAIVLVTIAICSLAILTGYYVGKSTYKLSSLMNKREGMIFSKEKYFQSFSFLTRTIIYDFGSIVNLLLYSKLLAFFMSPQGSKRNLTILKRNFRFIQFKYSTLEKSTDDFNESAKLGQGGYGEVFKVYMP